MVRTPILNKGFIGSYIYKPSNPEWWRRTHLVRMYLAGWIDCISMQLAYRQTWEHVGTNVMLRYLPTISMMYAKGTAVLSKWPIEALRKVVLAPGNLVHRDMRMALYELALKNPNEKRLQDLATCFSVAHGDAQRLAVAIVDKNIDVIRSVFPEKLLDSEKWYRHTKDDREAISFAQKKLIHFTGTLLCTASTFDPAVHCAWTGDLPQFTMLTDMGATHLGVTCPHPSKYDPKKANYDPFCYSKWSVACFLAATEYYIKNPDAPTIYKRYSNVFMGRARSMDLVLFGVMQGWLTEQQARSIFATLTPAIRRTGDLKLNRLMRNLAGLRAEAP